MAKIYWVGTKSQHANFTLKLLKWWVRRCGGESVDGPHGADLVAVSICHTREIGTVARAARIAARHGIPLLAGGAEAYTGSTLLAWADYLCVGEGYGLLSDLSPSDDPIGVLDGSPNVLSRGDPDRIVVPDYFVPWADLPPIQTANLAYYYLAGRGCHRKCKFCMTSWVQPHQEPPSSRIRSVDRSIKRYTKAKLIYVTNDDGAGEWAGSTTVERFLAQPDRKWPKVVRLGVEGVTEARRRDLGKPISDSDLAAALRLAAKIKRQLQLFFIVGFPNDPEPRNAFGPLLPYLDHEAVRHPRVFLKFTYFEPSPHTPMAKMDLRQIRHWDYASATESLRAVSGRFRHFDTTPIGVAVWSALFRRMPPAAVKQWCSFKTKSRALSVSEICDAADAIIHGVSSGETSPPWMRVKTRRCL